MVSEEALTPCHSEERSDEESKILAYTALRFSRTRSTKGAVAQGHAWGRLSGKNFRFFVPLRMT
jgi:hypothetical protein